MTTEVYDRRDRRKLSYHDGTPPKTANAQRRTYVITDKKKMLIMSEECKCNIITSGTFYEC